MASQLCYFVYQTPPGRLTIAASERGVTHVAFGACDLPGQRRATALTNRAANELLEYLAGKRREFDLPLDLQGTPFQMRVWEALRQIPYGQTRTYGQVAAAVGNPKACRAVGGANNKNPIPIIVPCHRVIGANGSLTGYAHGTRVKRYLLDLERANLERP